MLEYFWWGSVFLINVPVMLLLLALGPVLLPEFRDPDAGRLDIASAGLSLAAVLAVIYGLKQLAQHGVGWPPALSILAGVAIGALFVRRQRSLAHPLIDLGLFRIPQFSASLATNILGFFAAFASFLFTGQYLQLVIGLSPLEAGLWSLPSAVGFIAGSMLTPTAVGKVRPAYLMAAGLLLAGCGFGALAFAGGGPALAIVVTGSILFSLGLAPVFTLTTDLTVGAAPPERAGSASAMAETSSEFGGAAGIAILGSISTAIYRSRMAEGIPDGLSPEAAEAARDTIGSAVAAAHRHAGVIGDGLLTTAREAFTLAFQTVSAFSAVVMVGVAIMVVILLRKVPPAAPGEKEPEGADVAALAPNGSPAA